MSEELIVIVLGIISMIVMTFGNVIRYRIWSLCIGIIGGLTWLYAVNWTVSIFGGWIGFLYILGTIVWGLILTKIFRSLLGNN